MSKITLITFAFFYGNLILGLIALDANILNIGGWFNLAIAVGLLFVIEEELKR